MPITGNYINADQRQLDQNQTNPLSVIADIIYKRNEEQRLAQVEAQKEAQKQQRMMDLYNTVMKQNRRDEITKAGGIQENPDLQGTTMMKPTIRMDMMKGDLDITFSPQTQNTDSDIATVQRMAAGRGIPISGKSREQLLNDISSAGNSITLVDPDTGEVIKSTQIPRGKVYKGLRSTEDMLNMRKQQKEQDLVFGARKDLNAYTADANQTLTALDKIEKYAEGLGDFKRGVLEQAYAKSKTAIGKFAQDKNITEYLGVVSQELIPIARKLMEEKGPITEFDVSRVEKGLGEPTTPLETKKLLIEELRNKVKNAIKVKSELAGVTEEEFSQDNPTLSGKLNKNKSIGRFIVSEE